MDIGGNALAGSISPPYQQTDVAETYVQATITPSSSTSPTEGRRDTGDSLEEALNFWSNSGGLFSNEDIRNDAVLQGPADDVERVAIQKVTEGGLISTPPPRADDDEEANGGWIDGNGEGDILKSFEDNGSSVPVLPDGGSLKRSSISDAAMLPKARNEKARRLSSFGTTLQSLGYHPEIFTSAMAGGQHHQQKLQMDDPPEKRLSDTSLHNEFFGEIPTAPFTLDDDVSLARELLEENGAVQI